MDIRHFYIEKRQGDVVKGDHFIANKNPKEFNRIVLDFLKGKTDIWST